MPWKCPQCGFPNPDGASRRCESCAFLRHGKLILVSLDTERRLPVSLDTQVGQRLLRTFAGGDHVYAAEPQFLLSRDLIEGGWKIAPVARAKNPTFLNGAELTGGPAPLENAAVVSIGPSKLRLRVEIED